MNWDDFKNKFHKSWHPHLKPFIESAECNKIYKVLKETKHNIIYPKAFNTFRNFKDADLNKIRAAVMFREPFSDMESDGVPLSCALANKVHPDLNKFHNAMEVEFYDMKLDLLKDHVLDFLLEQDVFLYNVDLTVLRNKPGSHKDLWRKFTIQVIKTLVSYNIPIMFVGQDVRDRFVKFIPPVYPEFFVKEAIQDAKLKWNTDGKFLQMNKYIHEHTDFEEIMWVDMNMPF